MAEPSFEAEELLSATHQHPFNRADVRSAQDPRELGFAVVRTKRGRSASSTPRTRMRSTPSGNVEWFACHREATGS